MNRIFALAALVSLSACDFLDELAGDSSDESTVDTSDTGIDGTDLTYGDDDDDAPTGGGSNHRTGWTDRNHTCYGDGVDTMHFDDDEQALFIGCGSNADGYGLSYSPDRGETWPDVSTDPRGALGSRVCAVDRAPNLNGNDEVVTVDTTVSPWEVHTAYEAGSSIDDVQFAGSIAVNGQGMAVVEALNGTQIAVRWTENGPWQDAAGWGGGASYLVVGELDQFAQEMRNMDVDADGNIVVGGVDHGLNSGVIYVSNDDPRDAYDYTQVFVEDYLGSPTWIDGVCRDGDLVAAVGRFSNNNDPIALLSEDGGATWRDLTIEFNKSGIPSLYRCQFLDGGDTIAVAGADGYLGFYNR